MENWYTEQELIDLVRERLLTYDGAQEQSFRISAIYPITEDHPDRVIGAKTYVLAFDVYYSSEWCATFAISDNADVTLWAD